MRKNDCRHYSTWIIAGGYYEWCYKCGALRRLYHVKDNILDSDTRWQRPVGTNGKNPIRLKTLNKIHKY